MIANQQLKASALSVLTLSLAALLVACGGGSPEGHNAGNAAAASAPAPAPTSPAPASPAPAASAPQPVDTSFAPLSSRGTAVPSPVPAPPLPVGAGASDGKILAPGAVFDLPAGWQAEAPSSSMRLAQVVVPGSQGPGQMAVFYFGPGNGGGVEDNLQRWIGQMEVAPGTTPERGELTAGNYQISWVAVEGTLKGGTMGGPATDTPNSALLGAVVVGAEGPWFFKLTGPSKTMAEQSQAFLSFLRSARPKP